MSINSPLVLPGTTTAMTSSSPNKSVIVLLGGGHAAGKHTAAKALKHEISALIPSSKLQVEMIDMNKFNSECNSTIDSSQYNKDKVDAITVRTEEIPYPRLKPSRFSFDELKQELNKSLISPTDAPQKILIVHGLYALYDKEIRDMAHIKVFIDSDPDTRLIRWIRRDVLNKKSETLQSVINAYLLGARAEMSDFIFPTKEFADVIMPRGAEANAVRLVIDGIMLHLVDKHLQPERMYLPASTNYLRPSEFGNFEKEKFDDQKNMFYSLD